MVNWKNVKYFKSSEFDSPDLPGSGINMQQSTINKLDKAREYAGVPIIVVSGWRTKKHNKEVGGVDDSSHIDGYAIDVRAIGDNYSKILSALIRAGFKRIGLMHHGIHADDDPTKPTPAVWTYKTTNSSEWQKFKSKVLNVIKKKERVKMQLVNFFSWEVPS